MGVVRAEVADVVKRLVDEADWWRATYTSWQRANNLRDRKVAQAERKLLTATGRLGMRRWEAARARHSFHGVSDAVAHAKAIRACPAVNAALAERDRVVAEQDDTVFQARAVLAAASQVMVSRGLIGVRLTGLRAEDLARLARLPSRTAR